MSKIKNSKIFKWIKILIQTFVVIFLIGFVVVVFLQRISDNKISFFNYRMFTVVSGSMKPKYDVGDVLISKEVDPSQIKVGDTISYEGIDGDFKNKVITHEVIGIETDENGKYLFRTMGLANIFEDPIVLEEQLYGIVIYKSLLLSTIYRIVGTNFGFYILIILPLLFIIGYEIFQTLLEKDERNHK